MRVMIETFVGIIMMSLCALLCMTYVSNSICLRDAQNFEAMCIAEIEESDGSEAVIGKPTDSFTAGAANSLYAMAQRTQTGEGPVSYTLNIEKISTNAQTGKSIYKVKLDYSYKLFLINSIATYSLVGYAR